MTNSKTDIQSIASAAYRVRAALDYLSRANQLDAAVTGRFPAGCCGFASEVLGQYLIDQGIRGCVSAYANDGTAGHTWLRFGGLAIDITGDQFPSLFRPAVYIGAEDHWFERWGAAEARASGFTHTGSTWAQSDALEKVTALIQSGAVETLALQFEAFAGYPTKQDHIAALRRAASDWRAYNTEYTGGIVVTWNGRAFGWKDSLRDPHWECPNTLAIDADGNVFRAEGGDEYYGAKLWAVYG